MKILKINITIVLLSLVFSSCVTGNDDNEVLREHEDAIAKTARVLELEVNGVRISRDSLSNWRYIYADPGDQLTVTAIFSTGKTASEGNLRLSEYQYSTATPFDITTEADPYYSVLETMSFGSGSENISFTLEVPLLDADGAEFHSGDHINFAFWSWNDLEGYGYNDFTVEIQ